MARVTGDTGSALVFHTGVASKIPDAAAGQQEACTRILSTLVPNGAEPALIGSEDTRPVLREARFLDESLRAVPQLDTEGVVVADRATNGRQLALVGGDRRMGRPEEKESDSRCKEQRQDCRSWPYVPIR